MSRLKPKALSNPPSQPLDEGGLDSASTLTPNTVAHLTSWSNYFLTFAFLARVPDP